ncbi:MAG: two-component system, chemotaxis family, sensor kinase CheA [Epulopiscium sp.]|jgi:two-component system chemotaxis sensor kinase CheA|uniref:Chemotaxis protein CheA n=1 Tax=Defluviitalea raffinosedens TaxID=1450156 RepID=A0A7C8HGP5_9FIRM|nr:chemotaxis protein CheA [Defluviitalea raffinosedens]KAE9636308.1 chemotaxis protein CheA [Defluviitalea raffinosedens]MBM7685389.1 two-component system chemotaxis sensor kinase CheA [Defluviitalea raffinosedens]MDK2788105.1 two-component system, chemotaxis family, sensor kinase CheA [Candidatus Epulonipiscium sp.]HHW66290.1 chemotaxis protein CheA [Candidatus Epulonipiscium sp.]
MSELYANEPMLEMYIFETTQNIEQLETIILLCEQTNSYSQESVNEIFRIMHTIKGSSAMMLFNNISTLAHSMEDLFYYIREEKPKDIDYSVVSDLVLEGIDFIKIELQKIKDGQEVDGDCSQLINTIKEFLSLIKQQNPSEIQPKKPETTEKQQYYIPPDKSSKVLNGNCFKATVFFEDGCEMENIRAYTIVHHLKELTSEVYYIPEDIMENDHTAEVIKKQGFQVYVRTDQSYEEIHKLLMQTMFLKDLELIQLENDEEFNQFVKPPKRNVEESPIKVPKIQTQETSSVSVSQTMISVNVEKLDKLMDLVGEMVIAEAMVVQNPDLAGLELNNFQKAARQLHKITSEIQDMVMSIRMVPLSTTFHKMHRIVRDMTKKLNKEVQLKLVGEETEVDKNIIEHISDPIMHLIRNAIDHGIESGEEREAIGKPRVGTLILEAKNAGGDVLVIVKDDGRGLNKAKILQRARENNLLTKPESEMSDKEIYELILLPGFSTKDSISEFSGRGVGMDVVLKNLENIGGSVAVESVEGKGTTITLKIPLTLAIVDGMTIKVGNARYTIPTVSIKESFRPKETDIIKDPDGNEMIMVRGECYSILRLHEYFGVDTEIKDFTEGILIMVEQGNKALCLFADQMLGQQQVVVKALPAYIKNMKKIEGLAGCTLLGDGSISLILDVAELIHINSSV